MKNTGLGRVVAIALISPDIGGIEAGFAGLTEPIIIADTVFKKI